MNSQSGNKECFVYIFQKRSRVRYVVCTNPPKVASGKKSNILGTNLQYAF